MFSPKIFRAFILISQVTITMITPVFLCVFLGRFLSDKLNSELIFLFFLILGVASGIRNVYILLRNFLKNEEIKAKNDKDKYWRNQ